MSISAIPSQPTFHYDIVADNHNMDYLCAELQAI